ncbi:hypothetical protein CMI47_19485 [Candidatus Pacearchaeota archaeon]|nr:hypothetical protein [Candidatus Pacearchaeota archaeon]|tara:strand:- start:5148 stop:6368 length:1221 start_codon:yes stop_codon:yes gene_type:complete
MVIDILNEIKRSPGSNAKKEILSVNAGNVLLRKILLYGLDQFTPFNIVKVPKVTERSILPDENDRWSRFFDVADRCISREISGNDAIGDMHEALSCADADEEMWMRRILRKHLAIGASTKTVNKVFPGLIPTFDVSLAQKFDHARVAEKSTVCVEPKLDGIRCFAIVRDGEAQLFARSGKMITNFDNTIGRDIAGLGDGCYDGELMGEDFVSLMRQAYRKEGVDTSATYLSLFDFLSLDEWKSGNTTMTCRDRYKELSQRVGAKKCESVKVITRYEIVPDIEKIETLHRIFVDAGFEGAMIKDLDAPYKFGRGYEVMKLKSFHDVDLIIDSLEEGTGKHVGKLGSVTVTFNGVEVRVGSGFSDALRETVWQSPKDFIGRMIEVRYQEVTPDGSLRFPTFVCFRNDR